VQRAAVYERTATNEVLVFDIEETLSIVILFDSKQTTSWHLTNIKKDSLDWFIVVVRIKQTWFVIVIIIGVYYSNAIWN
jgi:hypothetical protein